MSPGPTVNYMRPQLARGQRQYINPFKPKDYPSGNWAWGVGERQYINPLKPKEYPSENWPWGVGEAMKQGKMRHYFSKTKNFA